MNGFRYSSLVLRSRSQARFPVDHTLAIIVFVLAIFGLIMISSASVYESHQVYINNPELGRDCSDIAVNCNDFYFWRQFRNIMIALPFWLIATSIPYLFWRRIALPFFIVSVLLLFALFVPGLSTGYGTAQSWLNIPILNSIQPSELAKIGLIFYFARWMERRRDQIATISEGFTPFTIILGIIAVPLVLQPDFGTTLVVSFTATAIYFAAGGRLKHIFIGGIIATLLAAFTVVVFDMQYVKNRFAAFIDPSLDPEGIGFQVKQSLIAVGKGGFFGQGLEGSTQRFGYLPEVQSDAIYAATSEAFGFFGSILIAGLFLAIAYRGFRIASHAPDRFGQLAAIGLSTALTGQAFIHIGVNIALLPLTGITLPFVSYGGSSLFVSFIMAGVLLNISKYSNVQTTSHYREGRPQRRHA